VKNMKKMKNPEGLMSFIPFMPLTVRLL